MNEAERVKDSFVLFENLGCGFTLRATVQIDVDAFGIAEAVDFRAEEVDDVVVTLEKDLDDVDLASVSSFQNSVLSRALGVAVIREAITTDNTTREIKIFS